MVLVEFHLLGLVPSGGTVDLLDVLGLVALGLMVVHLQVVVVVAGLNLVVDIWIVWFLLLRLVYPIERIMDPHQQHYQSG